MSTFPMPGMTKTETEKMEAQIRELQERMFAMTPGTWPAASKEFAQAANFLAHPMAAVAAGSALGVAVTSHAIGLWLGAVSAAFDASRSTLDLGRGGTSDNVIALEPTRAARAKAAAETFRADAGKVSRDVAETVVKVADAIVGDADAVVKTIAKPAPAPLKPKSRAAKAGAAAAAATVDDLKAISGIGPKLEQVLISMGLRSYAQIAELDAAAIAEIEDRLGFKGRIMRDDWLGQARRLAGGK